PQPVRVDVLHPRRPARAARDRRGDGHADRVRPGPCPAGDERQGGGGRAGVLGLALRGRRLGGGVYRGLSGGALTFRRIAHVASDTREPQPEGPDAPPDTVEMPRPTAAPLVLALGLTLLAAGVAFGLAFLVGGAVLIVAALGLWIAQLLP